MAERSNDNNDGGWWGYNWLQAAKEKSKAALEMVQRDLAEYTCTMTTDTSQVVVQTSDKLKETLKSENTSAAKDRFKSGVTSFLEGLSKALVIEAEDKDKPVKTSITSEAIYDRAKARLHAIQLDPETYHSEPSGSPEKYKEWQNSFDLESKKGDISELLVSKVELRAFYTKLVPAEVSHADFWKRYFYKVHQLQQDEARKIALMKRAEQAQKKEDSISWEDDWSGDEEQSAEKDNTASKAGESIQNRLIASENTEPLGQIENTTAQNRDSDAASGESDHIKIPQPVKEDTVKETEACNSENIYDIKSETSAQLHTQKEESDSTHTQNLVTDSSSAKTDSDTKKKEDQYNEDMNGGKSPVMCEKDTKKPKCEQTEEDKNKKITATTDKESTDVVTKDKGDLVVVNPDRATPSSDSNKENSTDDDWERDFDVELTEEELKAADEIAKKLNLNASDYTTLAGELEEDWESWE